METYLWEPRLEASGAHPSIRETRYLWTQQQERWTAAVGRKRGLPFPEIQQGEACGEYTDSSHPPLLF